MIYDVVIIGGGPSGSVLSQYLSKKLKVLIIDKRNLQGNSEFNNRKCCGGLLAPDAQKALASLGLGVPKEVLVGPQMFSVRTEDFDNELEKYYQRHYINVNREKFDRWLFSLIPQYVDVYTQTLFNHYKQVGDYIEVAVTRNQKTEIIKTRILVGADGATSKVRRVAFKHKAQPDRYLSIQHWYKTENELPHYVSVFDKSVTDFYSWIIQKDGQTIVGSAMKDNKDVNDKFNGLITNLNHKGYELHEHLRSEGTWIMRTRSLRQINLYSGRIALVGEAAGLISPSSAEGISYAIKSGVALAESLNHSLVDFGSGYQRRIVKLKVNLLIKNLKVVVMYQPIIRKLVMLSGILSMKIRDEIE